MNRRSAALVLAVTFLFVGCGADDDDASDLPPAAVEGRNVTRSEGCAACHGSTGGGGVGPAFTGLYGSDVELQNGETAVADREYLVESIRDPGAKIVAGYNLAMPTNDLSPEEIDAVIAYIESLAGVQP